MATKNRFQDKFSASKIGTGKFHTAGSFTGMARRGLAGALRKAKAAGKYSYTRNLSGEDIKTFGKLLGKEMSKLSTHSKGLGRKARARIMGRAEKLRQENKISGADKQDLRQVVEALGANANKQKVEADTAPAAPEPRERATTFITDEAGKQPPASKVGKADITSGREGKIAMADRGKSSIQHNPESALGRPKRKHIKTITKEQPVRGEDELEDKEDIIAKRENLDGGNDNKKNDDIIELDIG